MFSSCLLPQRTVLTLAYAGAESRLARFGRYLDWTASQDREVTASTNLLRQLPWIIGAAGFLLIAYLFALSYGWDTGTISLCMSGLASTVVHLARGQICRGVARIIGLLSTVCIEMAVAASLSLANDPIRSRDLIPAERPPRTHRR